MKKIITYLSLFGWAIALFGGIYTLARGEQTTSLAAATAILCCFIYSIAQAIGEKDAMKTAMDVRLINGGAKVPTCGSKSAAGMDLYSCEDTVIQSGETVAVHTGVCVAIPKGYFGGVYARSGIATKRGLRPANCVGVIDSDYRGEVMVALHNDSPEAQKICYGDRIAQMIIQPYEQVVLEVVDELDKTERGAGGFGHTGR